MWWEHTLFSLSYLRTGEFLNYNSLSSLTFISSPQSCFQRQCLTLFLVLILRRSFSPKNISGIPKMRVQIIWIIPFHRLKGGEYQQFFMIKCNIWTQEVYVGPTILCYSGYFWGLLGHRFFPMGLPIEFTISGPGWSPCVSNLTSPRLTFLFCLCWVLLPPLQVDVRLSGEIVPAASGVALLYLALYALVAFFSEAGLTLETPISTLLLALGSVLHVQVVVLRSQVFLI